MATRNSKVRMLAGMAFLSALTLQACATLPSRLTQLCGAGEAQGLARLTEPPENAAALREIALKAPLFPRDTSYDGEIWFAGQDGRVMLCRFQKNLMFGDWWLFEDGENGPTVAEQDGWITVTG